VEADLDGDGLLDHLVTYPNLGWRKKSSTTFGPHQTIDAGLTNAILAVADLDGDGDMDVIAVERSSSTITRWYRNDGSGSFTQEPLPTTDDFAVKIHVFDADGDGDLDIAVTNSFSTLDLLFNDGNEVFTLVTLNSGWQNYNGEIAILDVDRDGDLDIVAGYDPGLMWYSNDGLGVFTSQGPLSPAIGTNSNVMTAIDMDQDGAEDLIVLQGLGPSISIIPNIASNYYRIQGRVYFDLDDDGVRDPGEPPVPWIPVVATPASNFPIAMNNGTFLCYVDSGTFTVHPIIDTMLWRISGDSAQYTIHLDANNSVSTGNNFGITANAPGSIVHLGLVTGQAVCADTTYHTITYRNLGNREEHGTISFDMGPLHTILDSEPPPDSVVANRYYWSFDNLFFYETRTIRVHDILPNSTYLGQTAFMHLELITQDELGNNKDTVVVNHNAVVLCSYDPNDKQVSPRGYGDHGAVDIATGHLDYTIRFQNTGNAAAYTVTLRDTLPAEVRPTSVQVLGYSFSPTDVRVDTAGALMIKFQGINLPDSASDNAGSQGFITFRLGLQEGLPHLTTITNSAGIYFDLNPPVITNQTLTTLVDCDLWTPAVQNTVTNVLSATTGDRYQWFLDGFPLPDSDVQELVISQSGAYSVEVTSIYGCIALSEALAVIADGVQEHAPFNFQLAPNPASNLVQLTCDKILTREHVVELMDLSGKVLLTQHGNGSNVLSIILPKTASGNYVIRLTSSKGDRVSQPLIVR
ncbi:MAG: FG-GAP-like repeat-containing protein, partial [Flavobacteriales bacterium]